jgi:hypothetical protein
MGTGEKRTQLSDPIHEEMRLLIARVPNLNSRQFAAELAVVIDHRSRNSVSELVSTRLLHRLAQILVDLLNGDCGGDFPPQTRLSQECEMRWFGNVEHEAGVVSRIPRLEEMREGLMALANRLTIEDQRKAEREERIRAAQGRSRSTLPFQGQRGRDARLVHPPVEVKRGYLAVSHPQVDVRLLPVGVPPEVRMIKPWAKKDGS